MVTSAERLKILKMLQEGKINAEQAARLIEALEDRRPGNQADSKTETTFQSAGKGPRWFRVRITETGSGKSRVNVRLPVGVVTAGIKMGARFSSDVQGLDMGQVMQLIQAGETGQIVDVYDDDDGEHVEVFLE